MIYVGIDPGLGGAVAWLLPVGHWLGGGYSGQLISEHFVPTPTMRKGKSGRQYDEVACWELLNEIPHPMFVVLERAQVMPKQGSASGFNFGTGYGMWRGMLVACCYGCPSQWQTAGPREWQKRLLVGVPHGKGETKSASILVAKRLFGGVSLKRTDKCRKDDDGMSDALLLAEYGRRIHTGKAD